jgi:hypothetical protein
MSSYRLVALIVMMLLLALTLPPHYTLTSEAQSPAFKVNVKVNWGVSWEVRSEGDAARAVCEAGEYIYVVGTRGGSARVEMRFKSDGSLAREWSSSEFKGLADCVIAGSRLYVVGSNFSVLVFDLNLNALKSEGGEVNGQANSITFYNGYLYIAGHERTGKYSRWGSEFILWRVEKRSAENLELAGVRLIPERLEYIIETVPRDIAINPVTKHLWIVGYVHSVEWQLTPPVLREFYRCRVEILDLNLNPVKEDNFPSMVPCQGVDATAIAFDEKGYAYIIGSRSNTIQKYNMHGEWVAYEVKFFARRILYTNGYLYVITFEDYEPALRVLDREWNRRPKMPLGLEAVSNLRDRIGLLRSKGYGWEWEAWMPKIPSSLEGRMAFDGKNLYIVAGLYTIEVREQKTLNMTKYEPIMKSGAWFIYSIAVTLEELREPYTGITVTTPTYTTPIYTPSTMTTHEYSTPPATYETPAFGRYERSTRGAEVSFSTSLALAVAIAALITIIVVVVIFAIRMRR